MRIGIDLGGTKTEIICLHRDNGKELYRQRVPTPKNDYDATVNNIKELVLRAEETLGEKGSVGMGIPGTVSGVTGLVKNANSTWLNGRALDKDLAEALDRPVRLQNDANCFTVSEATDGAAKGKKVVFGVIIGTGCGGGVVVDGKPVSGINGIGGEWGHNPLPYPKSFRAAKSKGLQLFKSHNPHGNDDVLYGGETGQDVTYFTEDENLSEWPGPFCYCGRHGCLETWISGPGFKNDYHRVTGKESSTHDIIAATQKGDAQAIAALDRYIDRLARGLAGMINILDPDIIVLGGGMSNVDALYKEVPKVWGKYIFSDTIDTPLVPPRYGDSSGVRGAAWLWND
ncbi:MAG: ROK family protein [Rhodospirillales bacterium]|nr:ROK family protein [Rhodospirillales bacterium]MCB9996937.1 ROK family protein [Rhodospirillales bacterium]